MNEEQKFIDEVWKKVEKREQNIEILNAMEQKNESNMLHVAKNLIPRLGLRGLLTGITDVIAVSMVITICFFVGIYRYLGYDSQYVYSMVFIFSPILYASIFSLSYIKEMQTNTFHVQMSCRYTFFHVLIFRMILNSGLAILFNLVYICTLNCFYDINLLKALALSFSSLMLFSVLLLRTLYGRNKIAGFAAINVVWFGVNLLLFVGSRKLYMHFMEQIPLSVLVIAALILLVCYYEELKTMLVIRNKRRNVHA